MLNFDKIEQEMINDKIRAIGSKYLTKEYLKIKKTKYSKIKDNVFEILCYIELYISDFKSVIENNESRIDGLKKASKKLLRIQIQREKREKYKVRLIKICTAIITIMFMIDTIMTIIKLFK